MDEHRQLDSLDAVALTPIVRRALRRRAAVPTDWRWSALAYTVFLSGRTLARFDGTADVGGDRVPWSAVLKIVRPPGERADGRADERLWDREVRAYRSGLLADLPAGLAAPRALGIHEAADGAVWLWLEHVTDMHDGSWPLEHYGVAARHLGHFNGAYLTSRRAPTDPWLNRHWAEAHSEPARAVDVSVRVDGLVAHPRARRAFGVPLAGRARALLEDQPRFLNVLAQLPQTLCHHDAARANLFARRGRTGAVETVAVDWEEIGPGALGADLATFVFGTLRRCEFPGHESAALDRVAFDGYLHGLRDAGWRGEPQVARLGYTAAVALRWSLMVGTLRLCVDDQARDRAERTWRRPAATLLDQWIPLTDVLLDLADEARGLARRVLPQHADST